MFEAAVSIEPDWWGAKAHPVGVDGSHGIECLAFFAKLPPTRVALEACGASHH